MSVWVYCPRCLYPKKRPDEKNVCCSRKCPKIFRNTLSKSVDIAVTLPEINFSPYSAKFNQLTSTTFQTKAEIPLTPDGSEATLEKFSKLCQEAIQIDADYLSE